jgi:voltage-gated potassium channel
MAWRERLHEIIFEADTPMGRFFDIALMVAIVVSVLAVMLDSVESIRAEWGTALYLAEWAFTIVFTVEYVLRIICVNKPWRYMTSFYGIIDLLALLPTWLSLFIPESRYLLVVRILRVMRVFRVLKIVNYLDESDHLYKALVASRRKIAVFLMAVLSLVVILGSLMYVIEGPEAGFDSIPRSVYWAIVTLTTVGYGDIAPQSPQGQALAAFIMIIGYGIIAVPTGIVTAELTKPHHHIVTVACEDCGAEGHDHDAAHCKFCGGVL